MLLSQRCYKRGSFNHVLKCTRRYVFQSNIFKEACKRLEIPLTPLGKNPYDVFGLTVGYATNSDEIAKVFRELVQKHHPDQPGGSEQVMAELNAANKIIKEYHSRILKEMRKVEEIQRERSVRQEGAEDRVKAAEKLATTAGIHVENRKPRKERISEWEQYRIEVEELLPRIKRRYSFAVKQGLFFRKLGILTEVAMRERWLRRQFIESVWQRVHELRKEILRGGETPSTARVADQMVEFAGHVAKELEEDFSLTTRLFYKKRSWLYVWVTIKVMCILIAVAWGLVLFKRTLLANTFTARYAEELGGTSSP